MPAARMSSQRRKPRGPRWRRCSRPAGYDFAGRVDKYGGRVDALVATRDTADVSAALLNGGWARSYGGGRRGSWC